MENKQIVATCSQTKYRYAQYGTFEKLLYDLSQSFGGLCSDFYFKPPLSNFSQKAFLLCNHEKYARSINKPVLPPNRFRYVEIFKENIKN